MTLYVDDLTLAAAGASQEAVDTVAGATGFFVRVFEEGLRLEVSCSKSFAVAARPSLAAALAGATRRRILKPVRSTKMLGVPYAGGRRRSVQVLNKRLKKFQEKIPRIQALRRHRVNTAQVVRAMGAPGMIYGVDVTGVSTTHLHGVRVAAMAAALPAGASRNVDVGFAVLDAGGGRLDPAFAAHATPVKHWGLALWQEWAPLDALTAAFGAAIDKLTRVRASGRSVWAAVTGPAAAFIATVGRL